MALARQGQERPREALLGGTVEQGVIFDPGGRTRVEPGARRSAVRSDSWLSVSRKTTRGGAINGSSAN